MSRPAPNLAHSHTSLKQYEQCPKRYYRQRIVKDVVEEASRHAVYGDDVHKSLELRVKEGRPLPDNMKHLEPLARFVTDVTGVVQCELSLGMRRDLSPCSFFDSTVWLRGKIDVVVDQGHEALVIDYKTGKYRGDDGQPGRSALLVFSNFPHVQTVRCRFLYIQENKIGKNDYDRAQVQEVLTPTARLDNDIRWSLQHNSWPERPSGLCGFCPVKDCRHNRSNR